MVNELIKAAQRAAAGNGDREAMLKFPEPFRMKGVEQVAQNPQKSPYPFRRVPQPARDSAENNETNRRVCEKCPNCKIEIGASSIGGLWRHSFLLYTFSDAEKEEKIFFRYGPSGDNPYPADTSKVDKNGTPEWEHSTNYTIVSYIEKPVSWWQKEYSAWGRVRGVYGEWEGSYEQAMWQDLGAPLVELAKGPEWCGKYSQFVTIMQAIVDVGEYYGPLATNCNAGTNTMLRRFGLPFTKPDGGSYPSSGMDILATK